MIFLVVSGPKAEVGEKYKALLFVKCWRKKGLQALIEIDLRTRSSGFFRSSKLKIGQGAFLEKLTPPSLSVSACIPN